MTTLSLNQVLKESSSYAQLPDYLSKEERETLDKFKLILKGDNLVKLNEALNAYDHCQEKIKAVWKEMEILREECSGLNKTMESEAKALKKRVESLQAHGNRAQIAQLSAKITEILTTAGIFVGTLTALTLSGPVGVSILGTGVGVGTFKLLAESINNGIRDALNSVSKLAELTLTKKSNTEVEKEKKEKEVHAELSKKISELANKTSFQDRLAALIKLKTAFPYMTDLYGDITQSKLLLEDCKTLINKRIQELKDEEEKVAPTQVAGNIGGYLKEVPGKVIDTTVNCMNGLKNLLGFRKDLTKEEDKSNPQNASSTSPESSASKKSD